MKLKIKLKRTNTDKCSSLKSIIKCYFVGYSVLWNLEFNASHKKSKNTGSTKEDLLYIFTSGNSLNIFKCGIFYYYGCVCMGWKSYLKSILFSVTHYINIPMLELTQSLCPLFFYQIFIFSSSDRSSKTMKNVFYFILKALFVLEIFRFL